MKTLPLSLLLLSACLTGCYTQLATRGHSARGLAAPAYGPESVPADSLSGDSATGSLAADPVADTLAPPAGAPTVIVHNYYDPYPHYRGYAHWEWEYPLISFGYYSSHYGRYSRPYWWDDPWYARRHGHHRHHHPSRDYVPVRPLPSGPYKSDKRLFNPDATYKPVRKGRRAAEPVSAPAEAAPTPAAKESSSGSGSSSGGSGSEGSGSSEAKPQKQEDKPGKEYRSLQKGRRR